MSSQRGPDERIGDVAVDDAWRAASGETPKPQSDAAILAAARAETRPGAGASAHRRRATWRTIWQPLAAAAGVAGLAFLLVQRLPNETAAPESMHAPAPAAVDAMPKSAVGEATSEPASGDVTSEPEAGVSANALTAAEPSMAKSTVAPPRREQPVHRPSAEISAGGLAKQPAVLEPAAAAVPGAPPAAAPRQMAEPFPGETAERAGDVAAAAAPPSPATAARTQASGLVSAKSLAVAKGPEAWVNRIVELHASGNLAAAADELRAFRSAYPDADARLPSELREWANTVKTDDVR